MSAVLSAYFVAAGRRPGVILAPFSLLVGGLGAGAFAYDGRCRQPGRDAKRPRGFVEQETVPLAARVAAPNSVAAAFLAAAYHPSTSFLSCVRHGIAAAKESGAKGRATLLDIAASKGANWLVDSPLKKALIAQCGSVEGGLLTAGDLSAPEGLQLKADSDAGLLTSPWAASGDGKPAGTQHAVIACDARGLFAALSYVDLESSFELDGYEVTLPLLASPVLRGVTRVAPGSPLGFSDGLSLHGAQGGSVAAVEALLPSGEGLRLDRSDETLEVIPRRVS